VREDAAVRAAVLHRFDAPLVLEERPAPEPRGEEVAVRVRGAGVCHTDLHLVGGSSPDMPRPLVLGHEIAGDAEGIGDVLVHPVWSCGTCPACGRGEEQLCASSVTPGFERDGGYAELVVVPSARHLFPLEGLDPVTAAPLADAGLTPYHGVRRILRWLERGSEAVVLGIGGLGQFAVQYLKLLADARVVAVDVTEEKRVRALALGADEALPPEGLERSARAVLDFVGSDDSLALAARTVERTGIVIQIGAAGGTLAFRLGSVPLEAHFTTSALGSRADLAAVLEHARRAEIHWHVEALPLEQANAALDRLRRGDVLGRLVLTP
jgi:alcohol dehydrogenase, propanol-preferring